MQVSKNLSAGKPWIEIPGQYESLARVAAFIRSACQAAGMDDFSTYQVETAVDEACTNIIDYAYCGEGIGNIRCSYEFTSQELTITLEDKGNPFDPRQIDQPNIQAPLDERKAHGLGLFIIREWMDEVRFDFLSGGNKLTLVKRLHQEG